MKQRHHAELLQHVCDTATVIDAILNMREGTIRGCVKCAF